MIIKSKRRLSAAPALLDNNESRSLSTSWNEYIFTPDYFNKYIKPSYKQYVFDVQSKRVYKSIIRDRIDSKHTNVIILYYCVDTNDISTAHNAIFYSELVFGSNRKLFSVIGQHQQVIVKSLKHLSNNKQFAVDFLLALFMHNEIPIMLLTDFSQTQAGKKMFINFLQKAILHRFEVYFGFSDPTHPFIVKVDNTQDVEKYYPVYIANYSIGFAKRCAFVLSRRVQVKDILLKNVKIIESCSIAQELGFFTSPKDISEFEYLKFTSK